MTEKQLVDRMRDWFRRTESKFQRSPVEYSTATDVINGVVATIARLADEPERCVGIFATGREGQGFRVTEDRVFDAPREPELLPRLVAAAFTCAVEVRPVFVMGKHTAPIHGNN